MTLPFLISVPHAGTRIPDSVKDICRLSPDDIRRDGDAGAAEIFDFPDAVAGFVTTEIARAVVDMNRAEDDRRKDGVVKTHTCWEVPVYRRPLTDAEIGALLVRHHRPYHRRLSELARTPGAVLGIDCHTMAAIGPPVGPDPGVARPLICLGTGTGSCPTPWVHLLVRCLEETFEAEVSLNDPFSGGHITQRHGAEMPWVQIELSRAPILSFAEKRVTVLEALRLWWARLEAA